MVEPVDMGNGDGGGGPETEACLRKSSLRCVSHQNTAGCRYSECRQGRPLQGVFSVGR